jgi:hypothetical protein
MRYLRFLAFGLMGCNPPGGPPAAPPAAAPASSQASPSASSALRPLPTGSGAALEPTPPPGVTFEEDGHGTPLFGDLGHPNPPAAPCYGSRVYRGEIGKTAVTLRLAPSGDRLGGLGHYDLPGAAIELSGNFQGETFTLDEKGAGRFRGACDARTGRLTGTYELRGKKTPFSLAPRPAGEAPLHVATERLTVTSPVPPYCARLGRTTETQVLKEGICLPTDRKALAELQSESGAGLCSLELSAPRVFGLANPAAERDANAALTQDGYGYAAADIRAGVKRCPVGGEIKAGGGFSVVHNASDVLSVLFSGFVSEAGAAHGVLFGPDGVNVDLQSGRRLVITDLVTDEARFRDGILKCKGGDPDELTWGGKDALRKAPRWVVVPGGIAVVMGDLPPVMNGGQGKGPIASFAALAGRGLLRADSPVARLWAGVVPAAAGAPLCSAMLGSGEILALRRGAAAP